MLGMGLVNNWRIIVVCRMLDDSLSISRLRLFHLFHISKQKRVLCRDQD